MLMMLQVIVLEKIGIEKRLRKYTLGREKYSRFICELEVDGMRIEGSGKEGKGRLGWRKVKELELRVISGSYRSRVH